MKVSEKIEKQREALAAKQAAQNAARDRQQQLLDMRLSKITPQMIEAMDSDTYKKMLVKHGQNGLSAQVLADKTLPLPQGARRVVSADPHASVPVRDIPRGLSEEQKQSIAAAQRKYDREQLAQAAEMLSAQQQAKEDARIAKLFTAPYKGEHA